ncbi:nitrogen regulation protein NR(I) [Ectothiorhodospiraceae bacterium BW-2]|nr:nitrogen regulation protein NR(I) [Ectothiorhodospiraceae bacterium BW-2]
MDAQLWIVDDDRSIRWVLEKALKQAGLRVKSFESGEETLALLSRQQPDAIISDIRMPGMNGFDLLEQINRQWPEIPVIIMTAHSDLDSAVSSYQGGAFEYLPKPFDVDVAVELANRAIEFRKEQQHTPLPESFTSAEIIGEAPSMQEVFRAIGRLSGSHITVLINGESGTGKELVAHALHRHSPRSKQPFIAINTAAIPKDLLESELFGHERGAFTGANSTREGRFEQADGGTLFLDEIGDMPAELQTRLLRVLSDGQFYRVGGRQPLRVDVRVIAATHQNLEQRVLEGRFREDLFHRLNVIRIHIPSLRERREDIPLLIKYFMQQAAEELKVDAKRVNSEVLHYLSRLDWPGNVRQLQNSCRWLTVMSPGQEVRLDDLPPELRQQRQTQTAVTESTALMPAPRLASKDSDNSWLPPLRRWAQQQLERGHHDLLNLALPQFERTLIEVTLQQVGGRRQEAARLLGWGRNTLTRKIKELGMD